MEKTLAEEENENPNSPVSSSSSSSSSDDDEAAENIQIETLEKSLAGNPFEYDTHVQVIPFPSFSSARAVELAIAVHCFSTSSIKACWACVFF